MQEAERRRLIERIATRYRRRGHREYARGKLRFDPVYAAAAALLGDSRTPLLDIGCGIGLLGFYLRECGFHGGYRGVDFDATKVAEARRIAGEHALDLVFDDGNANALPPFSGSVALLDVLHYLGADDQQRLLREAAARVAPGALLIMRNVLREPGWRFRATVIEEYFLHAVRWMRSPALYFPTRAEIEAPLREAGLAVDVEPLWGNTPFNSFVIAARRAASAEDAQPRRNLA
jgi:SAM-dependent methyltransferase